MVLPRIRIAVVGDVHDLWDDYEDKRALKELKPDLVLFTGDFGNENVELVHHISKLNFLKAVILGNHDCWNTAGLFMREIVSPGCSPLQSEFYLANAHGHQSTYQYNVLQRLIHLVKAALFHFLFLFRSKCNPVDAQLQSLQDSHVGYKRMDISELKLSVIGARPFSSGGETFGPAYGIITQRFGIQGMNHSTRKISSLALKAPTEHVLVFLGHNGPTGLGSKPMDICGKDWSPKSSGDHGDPDLEAAIKEVKEKGTHNVQLVIFGHMHKALCFNRGDRTMLVRGQDNIFYVNAAVVPRVRGINASDDTSRNFTVIDLVNGQVERVAETWVRVGDDVSVEQETILYPFPPQQGM